MVVQKYGGTSVATIEKIKLIAKNIKARLETEKKMIVVVSAMSGETDALIKLGKSVGMPTRELDQLASLGENKTISLLAGALCEEGVKALSLTGWQVGMNTDSNHGNARIKKINSERLENELDKKKIGNN